MDPTPITLFCGRWTDPAGTRAGLASGVPWQSRDRPGVQKAAVAGQSPLAQREELD